MIHSTEVVCYSVDMMKRLGGKNTTLKIINKGFKGYILYLYILSVT